MWRVAIATVVVAGLALAACVPPLETAGAPVEPAEARTPQIETGPRIDSGVESAAAPTGLPTVNIAQSADLESTQEIEILVLKEGDVGGYEPVITVTDAEMIAAMVAALDTDLPLEPGLRCPDAYQLLFTLSDGRIRELGYFCEEPLAYLRGEAVSAEGQAVEAPAAFRELFAVAVPKE